MSSGMDVYGLMCCICFEGISPQTCFRDADGDLWDICAAGPCAAQAGWMPDGRPRPEQWELTIATCPDCGIHGDENDGTFSLETVLIARPLGTWSLSGGQLKTVADARSKLTCQACGWSVWGHIAPGGKSFIASREQPPAPSDDPVSSITCPVCDRTSYNPNDVAQGYCGHCHDWTSPTVTRRETDAAERGPTRSPGGDPAAASPGEGDEAVVQGQDGGRAPAGD